jgi:GTPase SAR1 family protein
MAHAIRRQSRKFLEQAVKKQAAKFNYEKLTSKEMVQVVQALAPEVNWQQGALRLDHTKKESEKRGELNHKILKGLSGNKRIIVEGPPGSGKSSFAQKFILDKVLKENITVLYLCWNEFLALHTAQLFIDKGVSDKVTAIAYFHYVNELFASIPQQKKKLTFADADKIYEHVEKVIADLQSIHFLKNYDLIVIDEGQDMFHKGIDIILEKQLNGGSNGLNKGSYIVFYDTLQAFDKGTNSELYQLVFDSLREAAAHYKLYEYFRTIEGSGIANFLDDAMKGSIDVARIYGGDMVIKSYESLDDCISMIRQYVKNALMVDKVSCNDIVVLFSSNLVSGGFTPGNSKPLDKVMAEDDQFEKIEDSNINVSSQKIRYTTAIKFKGLERTL